MKINYNSKMHSQNKNYTEGRTWYKIEDMKQKLRNFYSRMNKLFPNKIPVEEVQSVDHFMKFTLNSQEYEEITSHSDFEVLKIHPQFDMMIGDGFCLIH
jgi:hypothetical protein